ncbi:MAG TPA: HAD-IIB family hydrolase [Thiothrix sp.]|nr:HAD-IIB family hydrolase [Thiothrix sp.]
MSHSSSPFAALDNATIPSPNTWLVFTDLDGTLLDHHDYCYTPAQEALDALKAQQIPLMLNSSKTLAELSALADALQLSSPLIAENGSVIAWKDTEYKEQGGYRIEWTGADYQTITETLDQLRRRHGYQFEGFHDWQLSDIRQHTGLSEAAAQASQQRQGTEPLLWHDSAEKRELFHAQLQEAGLKLKKGGRFWHVMGQTDKVKAMQQVAQHYAAQWQAKPFVIALGDGPNDQAMLAAADVAVRIHNPHSSAFELPDNPQQIQINTEKTGPYGWNETLLHLLSLSS